MWLATEVTMGDAGSHLLCLLLPLLPLCQLHPLSSRPPQLCQAQSEAGSGQPCGCVQHVGGEGTVQQLGLVWSLWHRKGTALRCLCSALYHPSPLYHAG